MRRIGGGKMERFAVAIKLARCGAVAAPGKRFAPSVFETREFFLDQTLAPRNKSEPPLRRSILG